MLVWASLAVLGSFALGAPPARAEAVGTACASCHEPAVAAHLKGKHGKVDCLSCHAKADAHLANPGPDTKPSLPDATACQTCHVKDARRMNWQFSDHAKGGLACVQCHGNHTPKAAKGSETARLKDGASQLCASCHKDVLARFSMPSHHPVKEGAVSCVGCHDPHAGKQVSLAGKTEKCTQCHQAIRGPHALEHPPVSEDCMGCHNPHGSPNRKLLVQAQPALCLQCHSLADIRHSVGAAANARVTGAALRNCTACHGAIHGSASDQHLRF
ncbi:MAG: cytochrome c3 family protein [Elusimicrobia bacterium]|nr:cytochrome c3 family protein [Elusimicrobiota bacterium]